MNKWKKQGFLVLVICMLLTVPYPGWLSSGTVHAAVSFVSGNGSEGDPFQIATAEQLNEIRNHLDKHFVLIHDIDLSTDASTIAWEPIPNFSGSLSGRGNTVTNLKIQKNSDNVGLFANVLAGGRIENLFIDAVEVGGWNHVGILVGQNTGATVSNVSVSGAVYGDNYVGGLIGRSFESNISSSTASSSVLGEGDYVGGLIGYANISNISNSSASGEVWGSGRSVGGLVGEYIEGTITESYAMGSVAASRNEGGLVGSLQDGDVILSYATGEVKGLKNTGGLIGELANSSVTYSYATGNVTGSVDAGGLVGGNRGGDISFSFAAGTVAGCDDIGGLVGDNDQAKISNSYATVNLTGICNPGSDSFGGLVGDNSGTIEKSFAKGSITGNIARVGGIVGDNRYTEGNITNSYYDMDVSGQSDNPGQGLTSEQMKHIENYDGWDFGTIWKVDQHHDGYPYLAGMQVFLTYMGNDSNDDSGLYVSKPYRIGSSVTIEDFNWTREGYLFQGWDTEPVGNGVQYEIGDSIELTSSLLLYAAWNQDEPPKSDDANLAQLVVSAGGEIVALSPAFETGKTSYRAETTSSEATIEAIPSDVRATVTLKGDVLDGEKTVVLAEGDNVFEIIVEAEDGTTKTYHLTIQRKSDDANLAQLVVSADGEIVALSPAFETGKTSYRAETTSSEATIEAIPSDVRATVTLKGDVLDGEKTVVLAEGDNLFDLVVRAENGEIETYSLTIHRVIESEEVPTTPENQESSGSGWSQSNNANLAHLNVIVDGEELVLSPEFALEETSYRAETMSSEATIKVTPADAWAAVTLEGEGLNREKTVVLAEGNNVFEIVVKAESGVLKTYSLTIHRVVESVGAPTTPEAPGCTFSDVTGHWAESFICEAFERGIVNGHTETRFSPQSDITRVEFVAILLRTLGMTASASTLTEHGFVDQDQIPAWATSTIQIAVENGLLQGYPDHSLRPLDNVSRAEMVTMIGRAMEWENLLGNTTFHDDADIPHWAKGYIQEAVARNLLNGRGDNRFSPLESATRAEAAVLLLRLWYVLDELSVLALL